MNTTEPFGPSRLAALVWLGKSLIKGAIQQSQDQLTWGSDPCLERLCCYVSCTWTASCNETYTLGRLATLCHISNLGHQLCIIGCEPGLS